MCTGSVGVASAAGVTVFGDGALPGTCFPSGAKCGYGEGELVELGLKGIALSLNARCQVH